MNDDVSDRALAYHAWLAQQHDPGRPDPNFNHDHRITALEEALASLECERKRHALSIKLLGDHQDKQRAVYEALLAWATEADQTTVHAALLEALK